MQPKAKFWVDFFNYLFRVVTFKKINPNPEKSKRKNYHVALKPFRITQHYVNVWRGGAWGVDEIVNESITVEKSNSNPLLTVTIDYDKINHHLRSLRKTCP